MGYGSLWNLRNWSQALQSLGTSDFITCGKEANTEEPGLWQTARHHPLFPKQCILRNGFISILFKEILAPITSWMWKFYLKQVFICAIRSLIHFSKTSFTYIRKGPMRIFMAVLVFFLVISVLKYPGKHLLNILVVGQKIFGTIFFAEKIQIFKNEKVINW